jgi:RNA polymerase sigma-70 factor (ECF subfamily)
MPHQAAFMSLAGRLTGDQEIAKDILHDVYAEILTGEGWRAAINPRAFVMRIVYCRSINWLKKRTVVPLSPLPSFETLLMADQEPDAFMALSDKEELEAVMAIIRRLPRQCRQVVTMRRIEELPPRVIATRMGITVRTVEKHLAKGLTFLAENLRDRKVARRGNRQVALPKSEAE